MRLRLALFLSLLFACAPSGCTRRSASAGVAKDGGATQPLDFRLPRFPEGQPLEFASRRGNVVLVDVWATWCDPCVDALPAYAKLLSDYSARGFDAYAISIDEDARQIAKFLESSRLELPILHDLSASVAEKTLQVQMVPTTFLVDRKGFIRHRHEGFSESTIGRLREEIEALLAEEK